MDITFNCDVCGEGIVIEEAGAGMAVNCPRCSHSLTVPSGIIREGGSALGCIAKG